MGSRGSSLSGGSGGGGTSSGSSRQGQYRGAEGTRGGGNATGGQTAQVGDYVAVITNKYESGPRSVYFSWAEQLLADKASQYGIRTNNNYQINPDPTNQYKVVQTTAKAVKIQVGVMRSNPFGDISDSTWEMWLPRSACYGTTEEANAHTGAY